MGFCAENAISLRLKSIFVVFLLAALSLGNANAAAVTVVCPGTDELSGTDDILRQQQLRAKDAFGVACDSYGGEDILGTGANTDLDPPWDLLGKSNSSNNPLSGKLNLLDGYSFSSGLETRFKVAPTLWDSWNEMAILFRTAKGGTGDTVDPDWVVFTLSRPAVADINGVFIWKTRENALGMNLDLDPRQLRQVKLYGVSAVPLPAAAPLFAGALGVFGLLGWRKQKRSVPEGSQCV